MNLIELSNNLKDVPDHYLMNEVQQPTGAYPAYLVISELTRRKGMRDRALKNDPKSTVVEDLTQPNREQMMAAVAQMQQPAPQQQPLPPQMPMPPQMPPQIPQMPASGLMATPQASSLAATDAMASPRKRMAGGGLVAFNEGGDVKRFAEGDLIYDPTPFDIFTKSQDQAAADLKKKKDKEASDKARFLASASTALPGGELTPSNERYQNVMSARKDENLAQTQRNIADAALGTNQNTPLIVGKAPRSSSGKAGTAAAAPMSPQQQTAFPSSPTREDMASVGQKAIEAFDKNTPQRFSETEKEIGRRAENLKDRRKSAQNEALMMAGIGMLKSKSPGRWLGEGGDEGMLAYRQNMTNVRAGEDAMTDVRQNLAHQQLMQDLAKQQIAQTEKQRYMDLYGHDISRASQMGQLANVQEQVRQAGQKLPAEINMLNAQGNMYGQHANLYGLGGAGAIQSQMLTPALRSQAVKNATMYMIRQGITDTNSDQYKIAFPLAIQQAQQELMAQNPPALGQQVSNPLRGYGGLGATLAGQ
jgi:hypothetical protein